MPLRDDRPSKRVFATYPAAAAFPTGATELTSAICANFKNSLFRKTRSLVYPTPTFVSGIRPKGDARRFRRPPSPHQNFLSNVSPTVRGLMATTEYGVTGSLTPSISPRLSKMFLPNSVAVQLRQSKLARKPY